MLGLKAKLQDAEENVLLGPFTPATESDGSSSIMGWA